MTELASVTAASVPYVIDGNEWRVSPLRWNDYGELDRWMQAEAYRRKLPDSLGDLPEAAQVAAVDAASRVSSLVGFQLAGDVLAGRVDSDGDATTLEARRLSASIASSPTGVVRMLWHALKHGHPDIREATIVDWMERGHMEGLLATFDSANAVAATPAAEETTGGNPPSPAGSGQAT